ncbi:hypothetical protein [Parapedobacter tibetensis]|uniref:hypothetical protein n=1 Tax=Parapedobacter tibetensis TaxID=2972951 RepID=UPI00214DB411|nr:hypothetical protein [Parapedobacter tibetensis]
MPLCGLSYDNTAKAGDNTTKVYGKWGYLALVLEFKTLKRTLIVFSAMPLGIGCCIGFIGDR